MIRYQDVKIKRNFPNLAINRPQVGILISKGARHFFVRVFISTSIASHGTSLHNAFHLDKCAPVTQNSSQIAFSYSVTFRIYSQNSFSLHPAGRFQLQFVSLRSTTISPCTRVAGTPEAFLFRPFRRASHLHFWYLLFPLLFRCVV